MLADFLKGKKILLLGFGREGRSSYRYIRKFFPVQDIGIADKNENLTNDDELRNDPNIRLHLGEAYLSGLSEYDIIIKSPGISKILYKNISFNGEITSQTDLFLRFYASQAIGITGTKGKSTTTHLLYEVLEKQFDNVVLAGNMGIPFFDVIDKMDEKTIVVCELSSHQLEGITKAPHISILLNMFEEHLDYYNSYNEYKQAKMNIARFQKKDDVFIYSSDNKDLKECVENTPVLSRKFAYSIEKKVEKGCYLINDWITFENDNKIEKLYNTNNPRILKGRHNLSNITTVCLVSKLLNVKTEVLTKGIDEFKGLEHRLEYIGKFKDIQFYNDSISTIPQATIEALKALQNVDTLILGGFDRGIDYQSLYDFLMSNPVRNLVFVGKAGERMYQELQAPLNHLEETFCKHILIENDYRKIVDWCFEYTGKEKICLLSPAASSYDAFKNFEERGNVFKGLVRSFDKT